MRSGIWFGLLFAAAVLTCIGSSPLPVQAKSNDPRIKQAVSRGLDYLAREQRRQGYWEANGGQYRVAMTALVGNAMLCEGSTTTRGKYARNIRLAVNYLLEMSRPNGLIGYEMSQDFHYMYGHGFSMLFLSQVFGEEEDAERREELKEKLTKAVEFCAYAQTDAGGWGYVSAKDGNNFDEGSTCITQAQGLRACRNAGIVVPKQVIDRAIEYIRKCTTPDGGIQYSIKGGAPRPPLTAAAIALLYNLGEYDTPYVAKLRDYCRKNLKPTDDGGSAFGHWHYAHYYYAQVLYRVGGDEWDKYYAAITDEILRKQTAAGNWREGHIGPVYVTAINTTILQLENGFLPIYQR
ncbi:MAG: prenyltransferase/squalene oxidase repeat-containing protein [Planctomycetales bacterium]